MSKKIKSNSPLRALRLIARMEQSDFAAYIGYGLTVEKIRNLENPMRPGQVDPVLAEIVGKRFGILPESLLQKEGEPVALDGGEYTWSSFNNTRIDYRIVEQAKAESVVNAFDHAICDQLKITLKCVTPEHRLPFMRYIVKAAFDCGERVGFHPHGFTQSFAETLNQLISAVKRRDKGGQDAN